MTAIGAHGPSADEFVGDPREMLGALFPHLRSSTEGLSEHETARRSVVFGANQLARIGRLTHHVPATDALGLATREP